MAAGKIFDVKFIISALFTGAAAFNQAANAAKKTEKAGLLANISLVKMAGTVATLALGYKGLTTATDFIKESIGSAREAKDSYDKLSLSLQRVPQLQKMGAEVTKQQTDRLHELAEQMQSAGGISAKTLEAGFAKLSKYFSPREIYNMSAGFQDMMVKLNGVRPSMEEVSTVTQQLGLLIKYGNLPKGLKQLGIFSADEVKHMKKLSEEARRALVMGKLGKVTGETARAMKSSVGIVEQNRLAWEKLKETIGAPFIATQDRFAQTQTKLAKALQPIAARIADSMVPLFNKLADTIDANMPTIVSWIDKLTTALTKINWKEVSKWIASVIAAFVAFKAIQGAVAGVNSFATAWKLLSSIISGGPALFAALANPVTLTILGLAALAAAIYLVITYWPQISAAAVTAWNWIVQTWGQAGAWFAGIWEQVKSSTEGVWGPLVEPLTKLYNELKPLIDPIVAMIQSFGASVKDTFSDMPAQITEVLDAWDKLKAFFSGTIWPGLETVFSGMKDAGTWVTTNVIAPIINAFTDLIGKIKVGDIWGALQGWTNAQEQIAANVIAPILTLFGGLVGQVGSELAGMTEAIVAPFRAAYDAIMGFFGGIAAKISATIASSTASVNTSFLTPTTPTAGGINPMLTGGKQFGGIVGSPGIFSLAEKGIPEAVIPLAGSSRSRGLLSTAASAIGMGGGMMGGGGGPVNVNFSAPITISGVETGQEGTIGREVERALQDPIRKLLEQLKKARNEEARLSYA